MTGIKFEKAVAPLVLIMPKMSGYVKLFKVNEKEKDKNTKIFVLLHRWWEAIGKV